MPTIASSERFYKPVGERDPRVTGRLERFGALNRWTTARGGWITSLPGADVVTLEALPGSYFIDELRDAGHKLQPAGEGERIIPGRIVEQFTIGGDGTLVPLAEGSTKPIAETRVHAGVTRVERWQFDF